MLPLQLSFFRHLVHLPDCLKNTYCSYVWYPSATPFITLLQAELDHAAGAKVNGGKGSQQPPYSAFLSCADMLMDGSQSGRHGEDTRAMMAAVLLGSMSEEDFVVRRLTAC